MSVTELTKDTLYFEFIMDCVVFLLTHCESALYHLCIWLWTYIIWHPWYLPVIINLVILGFHFIHKLTGPGRLGCNLKFIIFKHCIQLDIMCISYKIVGWCKPDDLLDDMEILVKVMAWCRQATSHYLHQNWQTPWLETVKTRSMEYGSTKYLVWCITSLVPMH